jgi:hypothetical protein
MKVRLPDFVCGPKFSNKSGETASGACCVVRFVTVTANVLAVLVVILHLAIAVVLVRKRDVGFIWLGVALVLWPAVSSLLDRGQAALLARLVTHQPIGFYPFSLVDRGDMTIGGLFTVLATAQHLVGVVLLLVAVVYLCRAKLDRPALSN